MVSQDKWSLTTGSINIRDFVRNGCMEMIMEFVMMTSSNGNILRVTGPLCVEFTGPRWIPRTKASDAEPWCFFYLRLNKLLGKHWCGRWFERPSRPLWRHRNVESQNLHRGPMVSLFERANPQIYNCMRPHWYVIVQLSDVVSPFVSP